MEGKYKLIWLAMDRKRRDGISKGAKRYQERGFFYQKGGDPNMEEAQPSDTMKENWAGLLSWKVAGWIVEDGFWKGVRVAPWVVKQQKQTLYCSSVGFLKSKMNGLMRSELSIESCWGRKPVNIKMLDDNVVWMQFHMEKEIE